MVKDKARIALFYGRLGGGGAERVLVNLAQGFAERGFKADLVLAQAGGPHMWLVSPKVRMIDLGASGTLDNIPKLMNYLKKEQPEALISNLHYTNEIALLAKRLTKVSTKIIVSEQNHLSLEAGNETRVKYRFTPWTAKLLYPLADGIVAASQGVAQDLAKITGIPQEKMKVIYNPAIPTDLKKKAKEPLDHAWFAPGEPPVIIGVGRLEQQKDFPTLIQAFARVRQVRPARLLILGWGPNRPQLEALITELDLENEVALLGHVDNPLPYMTRATVFVLSSKWEGFGNVVVEAMALGTPVISTNCPSGPSESLANGKYGFLTPIGDTEAMAEKILQVLSGQTKYVAPEWLEQFKLENVTQKYLDVLDIDNI